MTANPTPPAPTMTHRDAVYQTQRWWSYMDWVDKTFTPGTTVEFLRRAEGWMRGPRSVMVQPGARGVVDFIEGGTQTIIIRVSPTGAPGYPIGLYVRVDPRMGGVEEVVRALDDNWGPATKKRAWKGRHTAPNPKSASRRLSSDRDFRELFDKATTAGWRVERTGGNHVRLLSPDRSVPPVITSSTPSDPRAIKNLRAMLRRYGLDV